MICDKPLGLKKVHNLETIDFSTHVGQNFSLHFGVKYHLYKIPFFHSHPVHASRRSYFYSVEYTGKARTLNFGTTVYMQCLTLGLSLRLNAHIHTRSRRDIFTPVHTRGTPACTCGHRHRCCSPNDSLLLAAGKIRHFLSLFVSVYTQSICVRQLFA